MVKTYRTQTGFDKKGLANKTVSVAGTITRTENDALGRAVSTWVGTDDTPTTGNWSTTNLTGTNMVKVAEVEYDGGGVGDGYLDENRRGQHGCRLVHCRDRRVGRPTLDRPRSE